MFNSNGLFPSTLNSCTLELGYFIIAPENKYGNNLIFLKNYFKDYNYQFLPLQLELLNVYSNKHNFSCLFTQFPNS